MFQNGSIAYIIENNRNVRVGKIVREKNGMYLFSFLEGGGLWIRRNRLYSTQKDAEAVIQKHGTRRTKTEEAMAWRNHLTAIMG